MPFGLRTEPGIKKHVELGVCSKVSMYVQRLKGVTFGSLPFASSK